MKIEVPDNVLIKMPRDRELQWAAMAIVQKWVNNYDARMKANDASAGRAFYTLRYEMDMSEEDFSVFVKAGLGLVKIPQRLKSHPDMVIDLSDERLMSFANSGKHVVQVCGFMCGEEATALPLIRRIHPGLGGKWGTFQPDRFPGEAVTVEMLYKSKDAEWEGIIGLASWEMYLAASMMVPTVEIITDGRHKNWLSKFHNVGYRMIIAEEGEDVAGKIESARESIKAMLRSKLCSVQAAQIVA